MAGELNHVPAQLQKINERIAAAAEKAGRDPADVKLIAVSKTFPPEAVETAYTAGQRRFGENRVQELETKTGILPQDIEWHLIGHLQGNKALKAIQNSHWIHAVDSEKLVNRLNRIAGENSAKPKILLEINVSGEESKFGIESRDAAVKLAECAARAENLDFRGLMTMAPFGASDAELHEVFSGLRKLRDRMESELSVKLPELSMGMSADFETAIAEGATMVRVGSAIFGKRD